MRGPLAGVVDDVAGHLLQVLRRWLAGLLVAALVAWLAWSWQQAPEGLGPAGGWQAAFQHDRHGDDDDDD